MAYATRLYPRAKPRGFTAIRINRDNHVTGFFSISYRSDFRSHGSRSTPN